ncbi:hydrogenase nickel incorporation protein HypB [Streptomyces sp. JJ66]|uniref:hydrogenase nickel incorporation protein HypB n=1 Tax=Streptomyces sp. JJ66 TaxID=2803843 RepID=UPI001C593FEB|nr:hydrogenase nickel incorporation protein HypB [Streptomyces sp. JJ66]MBW1601928.1 hydrogenase nickel incorporation protein HypB [Streptomyces sp. JJ66]
MCRTVDLRHAVLAKNDGLAASLRADLAGRGVTAVNLMSSPGSGKTALLERVLTRAGERHLAAAALTADLATENDARRLARSGAPVQQVLTGGLCHLECEQVRAHLTDWLPAGVRALFIENVGNLVCPASYDLGESLRVVLMSVTEGEDKPVKYPTAFGLAHLVVLTKTDLADAVEFDFPAFTAHVEQVNPGVEIVHSSARTGEGVEPLLDRVLATCSGVTPHQPVLAAQHLAHHAHDHGPGGHDPGGHDHGGPDADGHHAPARGAHDHDSPGTHGHTPDEAEADGLTRTLNAPAAPGRVTDPSHQG